MPALVWQNSRQVAVAGNASLGWFRLLRRQPREPNQVGGVFFLPCALPGTPWNVNVATIRKEQPAFYVHSLHLIVIHRSLESSFSSEETTVYNSGRNPNLV